MTTTIEQISVVIPVYNDAHGIRQTLHSVLTRSQKNPEVLVVDNGSTDSTRDVIREYTEEYNQIRLLVENEIQGSYAARNKGIEHAKGDVLVFLDADQLVTDGWLTKALNEMESRDAHYLAPDVRLIEPDNPTLAGRYNYYTGFPIADFIERHGYAPTACLFVTRELLNDVGRFDHRLISGGDKEFGNRVANAGYNLHYTSNVVIYHPTRNSLRSLLKRNVRIGRGHCQLQQYHPGRYGHVGIPPRPSGIHGDQIETVDRNDESDDSHENLQATEKLLMTLLAVVMTATRGAGYYRECLEILANRLLNN